MDIPTSKIVEPVFCFVEEFLLNHLCIEDLGLEHFDRRLFSKYLLILQLDRDHDNLTITIIT